GISLDHIRCGVPGVPGPVGAASNGLLTEGPDSGGTAVDPPLPAAPVALGLSAASSASRAACHRPRNSVTLPPNSSTTSSRKPHLGTRGPRNMLWTVDELTTPRPILVAIWRSEGWPAARWSSCNLSRRSLTGPDGAGSRFIAPTGQILLP